MATGGVRIYNLVCAVVIVVCSCSSGHNDQLFELISSKNSGIDFINRIEQTDSLNILEYMYFYNGAGVGVADINNDGLDDIYLGGNLVSSRLYLNQGDFRFQDITQTSGTGTTGWVTGISMVEINSNNWSL